MAKLSMENLYPIREVARVTGVNAVTLRAWERRYGLVTPQRTSKGHRVYSEDQIDRIKRITGWIDRGVPVGKVRGLLDNPGEDVQQLAEQSDDEWNGYLQEFLELIHGFHAARMDVVLNEYCKLYPVEVVTERLLRPVLALVEDRWSLGAAAEKAFVKAHLLSWIGSRMTIGNQSNSHPVVLFASLPEETDDTDAQFLGLSASTRGGQVIHLASGLSLAEITVAAVKSQCAGLVLHSHRSLRADTLERGIPKLLQALQKPVAMSGHCTTIHVAELELAGVISLGENPGCSVREFINRLVP